MKHKVLSIHFTVTYTVVLAVTSFICKDYHVITLSILWCRSVLGEEDQPIDAYCTSLLPHTPFPQIVPGTNCPFPQCHGSEHIRSCWVWSVCKDKKQAMWYFIKLWIWLIMKKPSRVAALISSPNSLIPPTLVSPRPQRWPGNHVDIMKYIQYCNIVWPFCI